MGNEENLAITPKEAGKRHLEQVIPKEVFQAVNDLVSENCCKGTIKILQKDIIARAKKLLREAGKEFKINDFFDKGWLDFEPYYKKKGWKVSYDGPAYYESYEPFFEFTRVKRGS